MTKPLKLSKPTVELKVSRIRRDPALMGKPGEQQVKAAEVRWRSSGQEITIAVIGIVLFALALDAIVLGFGQMIAG